MKAPLRKSVEDDDEAPPMAPAVTEFLGATRPAEEEEDAPLMMAEEEEEEELATISANSKDRLMPLWTRLEEEEEEVDGDGAA